MFEIEASLPERGKTKDRHLSFRHTTHGDISMEFWNGNRPRGPLNEECREYRVSHSSHDTIFAALMGYYAHIGISREISIEVFREATKEIEPKKEVRINGSVQMLADGDGCRHWLDMENGWRCIMPPQGSEPGNHEMFRTFMYAPPSKELIIAKSMEEWPKRISDFEYYSEFGPDDIPAMARVMAKLSIQGNRDQEIIALVERLSL